LGTDGNHLEPDLGYMVDAAALKSPGVELISCCCTCVRPGGTHLAQTFQNPRKPIMCPTLSLEIPKFLFV